ncbi:MAG TPA: hypothetical protein VGK21_15870, partial [Candidatus Angelobacter sp.]
SVSNPQSLNRYAYVTNDPINGIDPTGQQRGFQGMYLSAAQVAAEEGGRCFSEGFVSPCITGGNDIFDAIAGKPGTYVTIGGGHIGFGFDLDLWRTGNAILDSVNDQVERHNKNRKTQLNEEVEINLATFFYQVGATSYMEGLIPELQDISAERSALISQWPAYLRNTLANIDPMNLMTTMAVIRFAADLDPEFKALFESQIPYFEILTNREENLQMYININLSLKIP